MQRKRHDESTKKANKRANNQDKARLFSNIDLKAAELANQSWNYSISDPTKTLHGPLIPTGVVDIDESVLLHQPELFDGKKEKKKNQKSDTIDRANSKVAEPQPILPSITQQSNRTRKHNPYVHYVTPSHKSYVKDQQGFYRTNDQRSVFTNNIREYHGSLHEQTYDTRWWYMPINSVHGPPLQKRIDYRYVPPKWYEFRGTHTVYNIR